jgi:uncharacterized protein YacL
MRLSFAIIGGVTGYTLTRTFFILRPDFEPSGFEVKMIIYLAVSIITALIFYSTGGKVIERVTKALDKLERLVQKMTLYELAISAVGLIAGLVIANLIAIPIIKVGIIGVPISIMANVLLGCLGVYIALGKKNEIIFDSFKNGNGALAEKIPKIVDTSVLIDGRIVDIIRSGFLEGEIVVATFVLDELRHIADSQDVLKRNRGRRGLDVVTVIQKELNHPVRVEHVELPEGGEVDRELLKLAGKLKGKVVTIDFNLNKVANVHEIDVLNINELANAVKPIALPGEKLEVQVIKDGKENGQGIGYMEDGTMIVVDGGKSYMGETINVVVTSVLQTSAGRMVFAKPKISIEKVVQYGL